MTDIMQHFPFPTPRNAQGKVIQAVDKAFKGGKKYVILQSPVGSGKSAMAMTLAGAYGRSHILTPRKSLQDQYYDDFKDLTDMVMMKGRAAYPCTFPSMYNAEFDLVRSTINRGRRVRIPEIYDSTARGPCLKDGDTGREAYTSCTNGEAKLCPYVVAIDKAQESRHIVHNFHSFIFQAAYAGRFDKREMIIIDEAHDMPETIRDFIGKAITLRFELSKSPMVPPEVNNNIEEWVAWLMQPSLLPAVRNDQDKEKRDAYIDACEYLEDKFKDEEFTISIDENEIFGTTRLKFIPISIGNAPQNLIFDYGERVLLMSGTIYDKAYYCQQIGIKEHEAAFINVGSSFPINNRPIYMKKDYMMDTSHRVWEQNLPLMGRKINDIMNIFGDVKGLIHAPSYAAADDIIRAVNNPRLITHTAENFNQALDSFYARTDNSVFVSPICQQGVDMKGDRANFQIITRVPYKYAGDALVKYMLKNRYAWYNYQALIVWGQQIGRINRSEQDFGATILMDERFSSFIAKNRYKIPEWVLKAIKE